MILNQSSSTRSRDHINSFTGKVLQDRSQSDLERQLLIPKFKKANFSSHNEISQERNLRDKRNQRDWTQGLQNVERQQSKSQSYWKFFSRKFCVTRFRSSFKSWDHKFRWKNAVLTSAGILPAVILGVLLNILDALSYGLILFPRGLPPFSKLGSAGISMFYVSCIVSQLVFSCGGSKFKGGIGSEMIEVIPFFHSIATTILNDIRDRNTSTVIATTIVAYALSSILTGATFFLIGYFRVGYIVGFIPRHILIGCIGGVGWFLLITGIEVTAGLDKFEYSFQTLHRLLHHSSLPQWLVSFSLAVIYIYTEKRLNFKHYLPAFVLLIPALFFMIVASFGKLEIQSLRAAGWIFNAPLDGEPWWHFYTFYSFKLVQWTSIFKCIPMMFALILFGILHVPINVPSLAFSIGEDHLDLDRELLAHGASNTLSGLCGSIQNYLVYSNSLMVIKSGGDSRLAGILIALATGVVMMIGSTVIGYIPVVMVGVLIFILGLLLLKEAIWDPRKKLETLEYTTVLIMVVTMGIYDFVIGILIGIAFAFVSLIIQTSRIPAIRATYSGEVTNSTVRRSVGEHRYLKNGRKKIRAIKLTGYLFFGTIVSVEEQTRRMIDDDNAQQNPIQFLVFDFHHVTGLDYSAAEAFFRIHQTMAKKDVKVIMSGLRGNKRLKSTLDTNGDEEIKIFDDLNSALESCENEILKIYFGEIELESGMINTSRNIYTMQNTWPHPCRKQDLYNTSQNKLLEKLVGTIVNENRDNMRDSNFNQPLHLVLHIFSSLTDKNEDFWRRTVPFFSKKFFLAGTTIFRFGDKAESFFLLQEGIMQADYILPQGHFSESINSGTTCGELPFFSEIPRTATVVAKQDCITWMMNRERWNELQHSEPFVALELLRIGLKMTSERMSTITSYILTNAS